MAIKTYNPKKVSVALGNHVVSGYAEDSFVTIQQTTDGITMKVGCDGEVVRAVSPNEAFNIGLTVLQYSATNKFLEGKYYEDIANGNGLFSVTVKDVLGKTTFTTDSAWVTKLADHGYGREASNRQWTIACGSGKLEQE